MSTPTLDAKRHSLAHLLAAAVLAIWPDAKRTIGPSIDDGFYYDFDFGAVKISDSDLSKIEQKMREIFKTWTTFERQEIPAESAKKMFADNEYKLELISEFASDGQNLTTYTSGEFTDLCRGGHIENMKEIETGSWQLDRIAGAYWRGNEKNKMLTRIYGLAFDTKVELADYLKIREEAKKRDHKKLGKELDLFVFSELVGSGLPLWTPKGTLMRNLIDEFVWKLRSERGYVKVEIPHITKKELYITSGHWDKYKDDLFKITTREGHEYAMKPMNCPHHTQIFTRKPHSYKEMPQCYANTTMVYRDEQSGELSGLSRVLCITQDDAHDFCRISQTKEEIQKIWEIVHIFYKAFNFPLKLRLSLRDPKHPEKYLGNKDHWDKAEQILREVAKENKTEYHEALGEAAFYAPKLDFIAKDSIGREWQVATIQLDVNMPERFDLTCINEKGEKERIVMIHAAITGSIERFMSVIIEHFAGAFPTWLAPVQIKILPVGEAHQEYCYKLGVELKAQNIRLEVDSANESIGKKIRTAEQEKVPYMLVVGDKEIASGDLAVRKRGQREIVNINKAEFITNILEEITNKHN